MNATQSTVAVRVCLAGLALGVAGDLLLRTHPWGLNAVLWLIALVGCTMVTRGTVVEHRRLVICLQLIAFAFAGLTIWRDAWASRWLNVAFCLGFIGLAAIVARGARLFEWTPAGFLRATGGAGFNIFAGPPLSAIAAVRRAKTLDPGRVTATVSYGRGVVLALPIVVVFGALFASADPLFESYALRIANLRWDEFVAHVFFIGFYAWLAVGILLLFAVVARQVQKPGWPVISIGIGAVEVNIVLGFVGAVFFTFLLIQIRYLFGGHDRVLEAEGLTVADYARRGFFELSAVAALTMAILIGAEEIMRGLAAPGRRLYRGIAMVLIAMVFLIIGSAFQRMALYVEIFGLTVLRVWVTVAIAGTAVLYVWLALTILFDRKYGLVPGALLIVTGMAILVQVINPDRITAAVNVNRVDAGSPFDAQYATRLSADAWPVLAGALDRLPAAERGIVFEHLQRSSESLGADDWKSWNWARYRASRTLAQTVAADAHGQDAD